MKIAAGLALVPLILPSIAFAGVVNVATAANFAAPMRQLAQAFNETSGHELNVSVGSTGKLFSQIENGAPFDVFLAADQETPKQAEALGRAVAGTRFTYAIGKLVLWSPQPGLVDEEGKVLRNDQFNRIAIANPKVAPYGRAAEQVVQKMQLTDALKTKWVFGQSIGQTYQFVASGNAQLGFVALSQLIGQNTMESGSAWVVPAQMYEPLLQDAQLLGHGVKNTAAEAFMSFLKSPEASHIIESFGYSLPRQPITKATPHQTSAPKP
ncbi:MAG: molybdate ABC transporter substrate-binding protein [Pusillimonas sp.]|nr:molybdate ABC transporter substrate-binding protein [Pusillimonas sp.]